MTTPERDYSSLRPEDLTPEIAHDMARDGLLGPEMQRQYHMSELINRQMAEWKDLDPTVHKLIALVSACIKTERTEKLLAYMTPFTLRMRQEVLVERDAIQAMLNAPIEKQP